MASLEAKHAVAVKNANKLAELTLQCKDHGSGLPVTLAGQVDALTRAQLAVLKVKRKQWPSKKSLVP